MYLGRAISIPRSFLLVEFRLGNVQPKLNYLNCIMKLLEGKRILITGISSQRSISYGIAKVCFEEGAQLTLTYNNERFKDRVQGFANDFNAGEVIKMDVTSDDSIDAAASVLKENGLKVLTDLFILLLGRLGNVLKAVFWKAFPEKVSFRL